MITLTEETIREKDAKLTMRLATKRGMRSQSECQISPLQWAAITAICVETDEANAFMNAMAERLIP